MLPAVKIDIQSMKTSIALCYLTHWVWYMFGNVNYPIIQHYYFYWIKKPKNKSLQLDDYGSI